MSVSKPNLTDDAFASMLLAILRRHAQGLSEYECLTAIWQSESTVLPQAEDHDPLRLFQAHFLLFNALYRLRDKLWAEQSGTLEISPLQIVLRPYQAGANAVASTDVLREYYLNPDNLHGVDIAEAEDMLVRFWERFAANEELHEALAVLGLKAPVDYDTVKRRYRMLTMQHHPDRGGSKEKLQQINAAMETLQKIYT